MSTAQFISHTAEPGAQAPAVEVRGLRIRYGETEVVRGISLSVGAGEIVSLLGPSGCGKTTTLRAIAGFIIPEFGDVFLHGRDVTETPPNQRNIGMVFQGYALFPHLSVFDNVAYGLRMRKIPRAEIAERVTRVLSMVKLGEFAERRPKQLSGGQQQRVAIARALVIEPTVLLLDEPLSNLDAKLRQEMRVELRRLLKSTRVASIFVTHDQEEAMVLSDHIVLMNAGEVEQRGSPREIYQQPKSLFTAAFVGEANFLRGTVTAISDTGAATIEIFGAELRGIACGSLEPGAPATLVVKRERVRLADQESGDPENTADCVFEIANFVGANLHMHCEFKGQRVVGLMAAATRAGPVIEAGELLRLGWDEADALIFPGHAPGR
ncbi:MAG: ABC transporter ATP-binding protein [Betaproteobacteria bacterium]|nr:ABC transporter ATP-binding protein [Betaproteobacteria bacterium]